MKIYQPYQNNGIVWPNYTQWEEIECCPPYMDRFRVGGDQKEGSWALAAHSDGLWYGVQGPRVQEDGGTTCPAGKRWHVCAGGSQAHCTAGKRFRLKPVLLVED